jgi:alcohol dehydrogenase
VKVTAALLEERGSTAPFAESRPLSVVELELDPPAPGEVLVRISAAGLCHSDLSRVDGNRAGVVPVALGHEACGRVVAVGEDVDAIAVGDKVTTLFHSRCGECDACTSSSWSLCPAGLTAAGEGTLLAGGRRLHLDGRDINHHAGVSAFADHVVVDQHSVVVIPDEIPDDVGALLGCAILTGGGAVRNAGRVRAGDEVAVVGLGGVGLAAAMVAAGRGARVTAVDPSPQAQRMALDVGAVAACTPAEAAASDIRYDVVVEAAGRADALETAIAITGVGGRTVTVGLPHPATTISVTPASLVLEARSLIGSYFGSGDPREDIAEYSAMYLRGDLPVERLISQHIALDDINAALDALTAGGAARQVIVFDRSNLQGENR